MDKNMEERTTKRGSDLVPKRTDQTTFAIRLRTAREKLGFTQKDFAKKIGVVTNSIQNYEKGSFPKGDTIAKMASALHVSADWLLFGEGNIGQEEVVPKIAERVATGIKPDREVRALANHPGEKNIADLVSKTIEVLQSQTVFDTILTSNIEAFHHAITLGKKIDGVEEHIMEKISGRLDDLETTNKSLLKENMSIHRENQQLRDEIQKDKNPETTNDKG